MAEVVLQTNREESLSGNTETPSSLKNKRNVPCEQNQIDQLVEKISSPEVIERGEAFNKSFNAFSISELLRPFNNFF